MARERGGQWRWARAADSSSLGPATVLLSASACDATGCVGGRYKLHRRMLQAAEAVATSGGADGGDCYNLLLLLLQSTAALATIDGGVCCKRQPGGGCCYTRRRCLLHASSGGLYKSVPWMPVTLQGGWRAVLPKGDDDATSGRWRCYLRPAVMLSKAGGRATSVVDAGEVSHQSRPRGSGWGLVLGSSSRRVRRWAWMPCAFTFPSWGILFARDAGKRKGIRDTWQSTEAGDRSFNPPEDAQRARLKMPHAVPRPESQKPASKTHFRPCFVGRD
jgi:hypothetical protein